jgi:hypothetical protein
VILQATGFASLFSWERLSSRDHRGWKAAPIKKNFSFLESRPMQKSSITHPQWSPC